jgi:hypothetical protein
MKQFFKTIFFAGLSAFFLTACEKDENQVVYQGGTAPVLTANKSGQLPMSFITKDEEAVTLFWTNPNYKFSTGVSSQDVSYTVEIDTAGANFKSPNIKRVVISKDLSVTFTQSQMNDFLLNQFALEINQEYNVEMRVISNLANNNCQLISNTMSFSVRTYTTPPKVTPPGTAPDYADGRLFIVGSATSGGWNNPVPVPSQELTRISATEYEIILPLNGGGSYLLLPINGFWGAKYGGIGSNNSNNPAGDDLKAQGGDLIAPAVSGNYKIKVDFQRGKFTVIPQ